MWLTIFSVTIAASIALSVAAVCLQDSKPAGE